LARPAERARGVVLVAEGRTMAEVARILDRDPHVVSAWAQRYEQRGVEALADAPRSGRPPVLHEADIAFLLDAVRQSPARFGLNRVDWRCNALSDLLERERGVRVTPERVGQVLKDRGITFSRAKIHVVSPDPDYAQKKRPSSAASERGHRTR
jgi:transposase